MIGFEFMAEWFSQLDIGWTHVGMIAQLVLLEGLLSFDNALALAALVSSRLKDPKEQAKALTWGIWGAYIFRTAIVFVGVWLMQHEWVKLVAGGYLVWLAVSELTDKKTLEQEVKTEFKFKFLRGIHISPLWRTIIAVEMMDIMFSIDSIAVALAISDIKWVLIAGALLGILMMRIAAKFFIKLLHAFPILEPTAFVLVGIAGVNVILKIHEVDLYFLTLTINRPIPEHIFLPLLFGIFIGAMVLNRLFPEKFGKPHAKK